MWRELDSLLSAEEFVKSNEAFCDCESSQTADDLSDSFYNLTDAHRNWRSDQGQQANDVTCGYENNSDVVDSHPLFQSTTVRNIQ